MAPAGPWRSAWSWRCRQGGARRHSRQRRARPSPRLDGSRRTATRCGKGAGVGVGDLALGLGAIAGGARRAAAAAGGDGARTAATGAAPATARRKGLRAVRPHAWGSLKDAWLELLRSPKAPCPPLTVLQPIVPSHAGPTSRPELCSRSLSGSTASLLRDPVIGRNPYSPVRETSPQRQLRVAARAAIGDAEGGMA
jgi:hypothetical protein